MKKLILSLLVLSSCTTMKRIDKKEFLAISVHAYQIGYGQGVENTLSAIIDTSIDLDVISKKSSQDFMYKLDSLINKHDK